MYTCICGKTYEKANSLNAHYSHCLVHRNGKAPIDRFGESRSWAKGQTKETHEGVKKMADAHIGKTYIWSEERRKNLSKSLKGKTGGYRENSNRWKGLYVHVGDDKIWLDSSYELRFVILLNKFGVEWVKNYKRFPYIHEGQTYKYIPDFYIPSIDLWIETKGWKKEKDESKWKHFPHTLKVLFGNDIKDLEKIDTFEEFINSIR